MARGRVGVLERDTDTLVVYTNDYYCDVELMQGAYAPEDIQEMCNDLGVTKKTLMELISRGYKWVNKSLWKVFNDEREPIRLI